MGTPVPKDWPVLEAEKFYLVTLDAFQDAGPLTGCDQTFVTRVSCCKSAALIQAWIDAGCRCLAGCELCVVTGFTAQRIICIQGPYDDYDTCVLDIPPP